MTQRNEAILSIAWLVVMVAFGVAMVAGVVVVLRDPSSESVYRLVMALLFLGVSLAWLTTRYQHTLRRFFKR